MSAEYVNAAVTAAVGVSAYAIYKLKQRDNKKDSAKILLVEISGAESELKALKKKLAESDSTDIGTKLMLSSNSWNKYKHLFIKDFTDDQWRTIGEFYDNCEVINTAVNFNNEGFASNTNAIRTERWRAASQFAADAIRQVETGSFPVTKASGTQDISSDTETKVKEYVAIRQKAFNELLEDTLKTTDTYYLPIKPIKDIEKLLKFMKIEILDGDIGIRLRKIANRKF